MVFFFYYNTNVYYARDKKGPKCVRIKNLSPKYLESAKLLFSDVWDSQSVRRKAFKDRQSDSEKKNIDGD
jgi:hypothetical protein